MSTTISYIQNVQVATEASEITKTLSNPQWPNLYYWPTDLSSVIQAFIAAFSVIIISELGDKTFIISAIMSMRNSRSLVFLASGGALCLMTFLSVVLGVAVTVIPDAYTHYASIVLFICFGFKMLYEAYKMKADSEECEFEEVKRSLEEEEAKANATKNISTCDTFQVVESSELRSASKGQEKSWIPKIAPLFINIFTMVFVAEWGDRSQISTVVLAARNEPLGVLLGSLAGHLLCTGLAVVGGRFIAEIISVRTSKYSLI